DQLKATYIPIPAVDQAYAKGISLWQHKVIRRYAQRQLNARTDIAALAKAKAEIRALVERDVNRKSTRGRKRHARFMEDHSSTSISTAAIPSLAEENPGDSKTQSHLAGHAMAGQHRPAEAGPMPAPPVTKISTFTDD